jgi:hypothetical protein
MPRSWLNVTDRQRREEVMTKLQSQRTRSELKALFGLLLAVILAGAFAVAGQARPADSSRQHGALHVTKECSPPPEGGFTGEAGSYCTIKSSNLKAIGVGSKVFYAEAAGADGLDSDLYLYTGPGNSAFGHVTLSFATLSGVVKFSGGTGRFRGFRARVIVTYNPDTDLWHWDGAYRFSRDDD